MPKKLTKEDVTERIQNKWP